MAFQWVSDNFQRVIETILLVSGDYKTFLEAFQGFHGVSVCIRDVAGGFRDLHGRLRVDQKHFKVSWNSERKFVDSRI